MTRASSCLMALGLLAAAPAVFASTVGMELIGVGNGTNYGGVYDSPYDISINGNPAMLLSCDDFATEISVGQTWSATSENASSVDSNVKFTAGPYYGGNSLQTTYSAAAWLATQLVTPTVMGNSNEQIDYSLALWELFNPSLTGGPISFTGSLNGPDGNVPSVINMAFAAVAHGFTGSNVTVYTPDPLNSGQEFLQVQPVPLPASLPLLLSGLAGVGALLRRRRTVPSQRARQVARHWPRAVASIQRPICSCRIESGIGPSSTTAS
jgi:hypothetical protein